MHPWEGVNLADMKRIQCSSSIVGQGQWWLKLFFYLLNVGTGNALVLYNEQLKICTQGKEYKRWDVAQFKLQLIEDLVGKSANDLFSGSMRLMYLNTFVFQYLMVEESSVPTADS
jgi:hypothetical protein